MYSTTRRKPECDGLPELPSLPMAEPLSHGFQHRRPDQKRNQSALLLGIYDREPLMRQVREFWALDLVEGNCATIIPIDKSIAFGRPVTHRGGE